MILDGQPKLFPMVLDNKGNWTGKIVWRYQKTFH
jgi:hypothetical protein